MEPNNRELAAATWIAILLLWTLSNPDIKSALLNLLRVALSRQILLVVLVVTTYVWAETLALSRVGLWDGSHVLKTFIWLFSVGLVSIVNIVQAKDQTQLIKEAAARNFKLSVILTFVVNWQPLSFIAEFLLMPCIGVVAGLQVIAGTKEEYRQVKKLTDNAFALLGVFLLTYATYAISTRFSDFARLDTLIKFAVPIELSLLFIPLLYFFAVLFTYESLFVRLKIFVKDRRVYRFVKWKVLFKCNVNLRQLRTWLERLPGIDFSSTHALFDSFEFQRSYQSASAPDNFRGKVWGSAPEANMSQIGGPSEEGLATYVPGETCPSEPLLGVPVTSECYQYEADSLYSVSVFLKGQEVFDKVRYELQRLYGPPTFANISSALYKWKWEELEIQLYFQPQDQTSTVNATRLK